MEGNYTAEEKRRIRGLNRSTRLVVRLIRKYDIASLAEAIFELMERRGYDAVKYEDCYRFAKLAEKARIAAISRKSGKKSPKIT